MPLYFYVHDAELFSRRVRPALTECWRRRDFGPAHDLAADLLEQLQESVVVGPEEPILARVVRGVPFDLDAWRFLVAEVLLFAAVEVPELPTAPEALLLLTGADASISQAYYGSQDLAFGGYYRPDSVGLNDGEDVVRLSQVMQTTDLSRWEVATLFALVGGNPEDAEEELEAARESFAALMDLYQRSAEGGRVVVCEQL